VYKSKEFHGRGTKIINMGELFGNDFLTAQEMRRIDVDDREQEQYGVRHGDLLFARRSLVLEGSGKSSIVVRPSEPMVFESSIIRARLDTSRSSPAFFFYFFRSPLGRAAMASIASRTAVSGIRGSNLVTLSVPSPPLPTQRKVASILSAYDLLVSNNDRRIELLHQMASRVFREWFIAFRCPGHKNLKVSKSQLGRAPDGWRVGTLIDLCSSIADGDWIETKDQGGADYRLLQVSNIGLGHFVETDNHRCITEDTFKRLRCQEVLPGDILISRMPRPTGRAWLVTPQPWRMITAVDVAIVEIDLRKGNPYFILELLNSSEHLARVEERTTGTTRPRISRSSLASIPILIPPLSLQDRFGRFAAGVYQLSDSLRKRNANLRRTRDFLLPKLISGELDVSDLDIPTEAIV
jgi:type I restriction enzyme S subunit